MLYTFDKDIQQSLKSIQGSNISSSTLQTVQSSLSNMILSGKYISSVVLIDAYGSHYKSYKVGPIAVDTQKLQKTHNGSKQMEKANGDGFLYIKVKRLFSIQADRSKLYYICSRSG